MYEKNQEKIQKMIEHVCKTDARRAAKEKSTEYFDEYCSCISTFKKNKDLASAPLPQTPPSTPG